jgi:hypothetical protein
MLADKIQNISTLSWLGILPFLSRPLAWFYPEASK